MHWTRLNEHLKRGLIVLGFGCACAAPATERFFTYTYEPETMPAGAAEFEQWITLRTGRNAAVGQDNFNLWELRQELEYGVTDNYSLSLYLNESAQSYRDPTTGADVSSSHFDGISLENRYQVLNPAEHSVGLTLYVEPRYSGDQAEIEERIIVGQRIGDWKWAFNLTHATEWTENLSATEGEVEGSVGLTRRLGRHWSAGLEARDHSDLPEYRTWENTAVYVGPVVTFQRESWWVTLTVMPQVYGGNFVGDPDHNPHLELEDHERWNIRLILGISL